MLVTLAASFKLLAANVAALETVNMALSNKNFQMILYPIAQERGYMQEEGIHPGSEGLRLPFRSRSRPPIDTIRLATLKMP